MGFEKIEKVKERETKDKNIRSVEWNKLKILKKSLKGKTFEEQSLMLKPSTNILIPQKLVSPRVMLQVSARGPVPVEENTTLTIPSGMKYKVRDEDMSGGEDSAWKTIADKFGLSKENLTVFNVVPETKSLIQISSGVEIYIPSPEEVLFSQIYEYAGRDYKKSEKIYGEMKSSGNLQILKTARKRASEKIGESYGVMGIGGDERKIGYFLSPNPKLAGASEKRTEKIGGVKNYKIFWVNDWKCNIFMNDTIYQAGFKPAQYKTPKGMKYYPAGQVHKAGVYEEVNVKDARPGYIFQKFGGTQSNESHNAILSSFVEIKSEHEYEKWTFSIIGAEFDRARESTRSYRIKKGTNQSEEGLTIRFLKPKFKR